MSDDVRADAAGGAAAPRPADLVFEKNLKSGELAALLAILPSTVAALVRDIVGNVDRYRNHMTFARATALGEEAWLEQLKMLQRFLVSRSVRALIDTIRHTADRPDLLEFMNNLYRNHSVAEDLFATRAAAAWLEDPRFVAAYEAGSGISVWGASIRWRVHTLLKCAVHGARIAGDFVECGVDRGGTAMSVITYLTPEAFAGRTFYLFDTYEGVKKEQMTERELELSRLRDGRYVPVYEKVQETFAPHPFVRLVRGMVPDTLSAFKGKNIAYLHIDMNVSGPECEAFRYFWPYLTPGAAVVFDDYGFPFHREQRKALDDVAASLGGEIMMLPTGQGLIWK